MSLEAKRWSISLSPPLADDIEAIVHYRFNSTAPIHFYPEGRVELLFQFGSDFLHSPPRSEEWFIRPNGFLGGLHLGRYQVQALAPQAFCLGIIFRPGKAHYYIPFPLNQINNSFRSTNEIWGLEGTSLERAVLSASDRNQQIDHVVKFLVKSRREVNSSVANACTLVESRSGDLQVGEIAKATHMSVAHLRKNFHRSVGVSPKRFCQITRVRRARQYLEDTEYQLSAVGHLLGYYDQAHFVREFKRLTDTTPRRFRSRSWR